MTLWRDLSYSLRGIRRNPGFAAVAILSIGIGVAANATVFSLVNAALFGSLPVREPERLVSLINNSRGATFPYPEYQAFQTRAQDTVEDMAACFPVVAASLNTAGSEPERIWGQIVSGNYFGVVGARPYPGRGFLPEEDKTEGTHQVVVLSYGLWQRRFGADPGVLSRPILLNGRRFTVVGIAPRGFAGTQRGLVPEFFVPLALVKQFLPGMKPDELKADHHAQWLMLDARLRPGVTRRQAASVLNTIHSSLEDTYRKGDRKTTLRLEDAGGLMGGSAQYVRPALLGVMVVASLVLLIACANVANLLLARASGRQREIGIRMAIGAARAQILRQLLTESLTLAIGGGLVGLALAAAATQAMGNMQLPIPIPVALSFTPDWRVFAYTTVLSFLAAMAFGLAPAFHAVKTSLAAVIKDEATPVGNIRRLGVRNVLVLVQITLSVVLLMGAGLFLRSLGSAASVDLGLKPDGLLLLSVDTALHGYSPQKTQVFLDELKRRVLAQPGVVSMSYTDIVPLSFGGITMDFAPRGISDPSKAISADVYAVDEDYFQTLAVPLLRGRLFQREEKGQGLVAMVNEEFVRQAFSGGNAIGETVTEPHDKTTYEIVGVVKNSKSRTLGEESRPMIYRCYRQSTIAADAFFGNALIVRTMASPAALALSIRSEIHALDPDLPVFGQETMAQHVEKALLLPKVCGILFGVFGACGVTLAIIGLYGVMSYVARMRTREIGIRIALGANRGQLLRAVGGQGIAVALTGLMLGLALSLAASRAASSLLYGISATDPLTFFGIPVLMLAVSLAAILVPARRAMNMDPMRALRHD
jgi:macrolide transport system ATP-binding/permease protein